MNIVDKFWTSKVLPTVYDDSLSYYEVLCKLVNYIRELSEAVDNIDSAVIKLREFVNEQLKLYTVEQLTLWKNDGTLADLVNNVLLPDKADKITAHSAIKTNPTVISEMLKCAFTYVKNNSKLFYSNNTALNVSMDSEGEGSATRYGIDCSTFVALVVKGVPFEKSRYATPSSGTRDSNIRDYIWGTDIYSWGEFDVEGVKEYRRYANMLAKYLYDNGLTYYPNSDFTNLSVGDIMFWKGDSSGVVGSFMDITHTGIFMGIRYDGKVMFVDCNTGRGATPVTIAASTINEVLRNNVVLCGKAPFNGVDYTYGVNIINGNFPITIDSEGVRHPLLSKAESEYYTIVIKGKGVAPKVAITDGVSTQNCVYIGNGLYVARVRINAVSSAEHYIRILNDEHTTFDCEWCCCYKGYIAYPYNEYLEPANDDSFCKIYLNTNKSINGATVNKFALDGITGKHHTNIYKLTEDGCVEIAESGKYLICAQVTLNDNQFIQVNLSAYKPGSDTTYGQNVFSMNGVEGHASFASYSVISYLEGGQRIGFRMSSPGGESVIVGGQRNTYIIITRIR